MSLSPAELSTLVQVATEAVQRAVVDRRTWHPDLATIAPVLQSPGAAFVTLRRDGMLRGCIGTLTAVEPLVWCVADRARAAALSDPRFRPIRRDDLPFLDIEVSVLSEPEAFEVASYVDLICAVRPGVDGLVVEAGPQRATLLPAVWDDLPTAEEFVAALWHKAGLMPRYWSAAIRMSRYTATHAESHVGRGPDCGGGGEATW
jgi:AmmeMemoRadiSam system protein A